MEEEHRSVIYVINVLLAVDLVLRFLFGNIDTAFLEFLHHKLDIFIAYEEVVTLFEGNNTFERLFKFVHIEVVKIILSQLGKPESLITYVTDRKGHDLRYAIDPAKIHAELGWLPETKFEDGIRKTIRWYIDNEDWWQNIISGEYQQYYEKMYGNR